MRNIFPAGLLSVALALGGCSRSQPDDPNARAYEVRGIVRAFAPDRSTIDVQHEDIPGFMPSMTMPFTVKEQKEIAGLGIGDAISFRMTVTDKDLFIDRVKKIGVGDVRLPQATPTAAAANAPRPADRLKEGEIVPFFTLTNQDGVRVTSDTFRGQPYVLTFIFTRCPVPNFCPRMSNNFTKVQEGVKSEPALNRVRLLSISLDPAFDTPAILKGYGEHLQADFATWHFVTGELGQIKTLTESFGVYVQPEGGTISHGLATALIGTDGSVVKIWRGNEWTPTEVIEALRKL